MSDAMASAPQDAKHAAGTAKIMKSASDFQRWGRKSPFLRYGLPLYRTEMVKEKDDLEWEVIENSRALSRTDPKKGQAPKKNFPLDEELKMLQKKIDIHNFEYKEVPRPTGGQSNKN